MSAQLDIQIKPCEGALVRLLGLVERRGFMIAGLDLPSNPSLDEGAKPLALSVTPREPWRTTDGLVRQIEKLVDVISVSQADADAPSGND